MSEITRSGLERLRLIAVANELAEHTLKGRRYWSGYRKAVEDMMELVQ